MLLFILKIILLSSLWAQSDLQIAMQVTRTWVDWQKSETFSRDLYPHSPEKMVTITSGIPQFINPFNHQGRTVFRHYTTQEGLKKILSSKKLKTGITPYVIVHPGFGREIFEDVVGMFLTYPHIPAHEIGLSRQINYSYVDFTLNSKVPVMEIEPSILIIPGRRDAPQWIKDLYFEYKKTGRVDPVYQEMFEKFDDQGGIRPSYMSINVVEYGFR